MTEVSAISEADFFRGKISNIRGTAAYYVCGEVTGRCRDAFKKAFYKCSKLNSIIFANPDASALTIKSKALYGLSKNCKVVVSADKTDAYTKLLRSKGLNKKIKIMNKSEYLK